MFCPLSFVYIYNLPKPKKHKIFQHNSKKIIRTYYISKLKLLTQNVTINTKANQSKTIKTKLKLS